VHQYYTLLMAPQNSDGGSGLIGFLPLVLMVLIFYFMIMRPSQKRRKDHQMMLDNIKKGDKVVTSGGIHGTVAGLDEKTVLVEIADKVKVKLDRGYIANVISDSAIEQK
jgi:preprotein translocase subunit YajC